VSSVNQTLRDKARELLAGGAVGVVIGYEEATRDQRSSVSEVRSHAPGERTTPAFITRPEDCDRLVFNRRCFVNLTNYLTKPEVIALGRPAIVSKGCDNRAINVLIREQRVKREEVHILGVECPGMDKGVCAWCDQHAPVTFDDLIPCDHSPARRLPLPPSRGKGPGDGGDEDMTADERWKYWLGEFSRCIRCYACRQVCPMCHCTRCLAEKNQPQWIDTSPHPRGNLTWNLIRAFHLAGRCVECGECERACPMDIPLSRLSRDMRDLMRERFGAVPGMDAETPSPLATFREDDEEDFLR
jgi:formate dehydrogenase subunit beta